LGERNESKIINRDEASKSGSDYEITLMIDERDDVITVDDDGNVSKGKQPIQMALAHEVVHAYRGMNGLRKPDGTMGTNIMVNGDNKYWKQEEYDTVGINYSYEENGVTKYAYPLGGYFTENSLRKENGLPIRINYIHTGFKRRR